MASNVPIVTTQHSEAGALASPLRRTPAAVAVARVLLDHHATMCAAVSPRCLPDPQQLHQLRVAMRHSRSLLRAYREVLGRDLARHFQAQWRWLAAATSRLRDIDVLYTAVLEASADYTALDSRSRTRLATFLQAERARDAERLQRRLAGARYARLRRRWPRTLTEVITRTAPDAPTIGAAAAAAIGKALARLRRDIATVATDSSAGAVHELRKQCKRLRYLVEPCASLYPPAPIAAVQSALKQVQTLLGKRCDRHAQLVLLRGHLWRRAKGRPALRTVLHSANRALHAGLAERDVETLANALAAFDDGRHHAALDALFGMAEL